MRDDFSGEDLKTVWQNQPLEVSTMTLEKIRQKARELHAKARREVLGTLAAPAVVVFGYVFCTKEFPQTERVIQPLLALSFAWSLAGLYFLTRGRWAVAMPGDTGFSAGLEFCRRELERRRDYFRRALLWSFAPMLLVLSTITLAVTIAAGRRIFPNAMPFVVFVLVWIAKYLLIRAKEARNLRREIDELNAIENHQ